MTPRTRTAVSAILLMLVGLSGVPRLRAEDPTAAADRIDQLLKSEGPTADEAKFADRSSDETFLRRVFLDLIGEPPTADDVIAFALDQRPEKRRRIVETLLKDPAYGKNWGSYWRDVIMYRRTEQRAGLAVGPLGEYLTEQFSQNASWDRIATSLITATGDVRDNGATGLIMAQGGRPEETVGEVSRIFLGIQIQCAQCHDHPTDQWKRDQFHQLAAFFPRVAVRPNPSSDTRSFIVAVNDSPFRLRPRTNNNNRYRGTLEHHMPDLEDPSQKGELMKPVLFATGQSLPIGTRDSERRGQLADWITDEKNPWFSKALVNRIWGELVGEGFYEPVDDLGPERDCSAPQTIDYLARQFAAESYDMHWLLKTITATDAYQRQSRPRRNLEQSPFTANCPQRLRADQLFESLKAALDFSEPAPRQAGPYAARFGPRTQFNLVFGYDPSERREEVAGSIAQALLFMNSPMINQAIDSRRNAGLGRILREFTDNEQAIREVYLKTLSRQPTRVEMKTCMSFLEDVGDREEAFEDLLWALINSTEFLYRN